MQADVSVLATYSNLTKTMSYKTTKKSKTK